MKIFDITLTITPGMIVWPGDPAVVLERVQSMDEGAKANVSHLELSVHTGTMWTRRTISLTTGSRWRP